MTLDFHRSRPLLCSALATAYLFTLACGCSSSKKEDAEPTGETTDAISTSPATAGTDPIPANDANVTDNKTPASNLAAASTPSVHSSAKKHSPPKVRKPSPISRALAQPQDRLKQQPSVAQDSVTAPSSTQSFAHPTPLQSAPPPASQALNLQATPPLTTAPQTARAPASPRNTEQPSENESIAAETESGILPTLLANRAVVITGLALAAMSGGAFSFWRRRRSLI